MSSCEALTAGDIRVTAFSNYEENSVENKDLSLAHGRPCHLVPKVRYTRKRLLLFKIINNAFSRVRLEGMTLT